MFWGKGYTFVEARTGKKEKRRVTVTVELPQYQQGVAPGPLEGVPFDSSCAHLVVGFVFARKDLVGCALFRVVVLFVPKKFFHKEKSFFHKEKRFLQNEKRFFQKEKSFFQKDKGFSEGKSFSEGEKFFLEGKYKISPLSCLRSPRIDLAPQQAVQQVRALFCAG